jgi:DNA-binding NtrC family response regulator
MAARVLICDDDALVRSLLRRLIGKAGYEVIEAEDGAGAIAAMERTDPALMIIDLILPGGMDGVQLIRQVRQRGRDLPLIVLSGQRSLDAALETGRLGVVDFLTKPVEPAVLMAAIERGLRQQQARSTVVEAGEGPSPQVYEELIGASKPMRDVFAILATLEAIDPPTILVTGESGTGKDLIARAVHRRGPRSGGPFVEVDCTALPENLVESTLFGHERGAFTDAKAQRQGLFETAREGVVFLDEIGELPLSAQSKLLRSLENRRFKRVGGTETIQFGAAIVAATNRDLRAEVQAGRFREDLYFRLAVVPVHLPPLRQRPEDIPALVDHFLELFNRQFDRHLEGLTQEALEVLKAYRWPGNVRQLRNLLERLVIFATDDVIRLDALPPAVRFADPDEPVECPYILPADGIPLEVVERSLVQQALRRVGGNQSEAARLLSLSRYMLRTRMKRYGLL